MRSLHASGEAHSYYATARTPEPSRSYNKPARHRVGQYNRDDNLTCEYGPVCTQKPPCPILPRRRRLSHREKLMVQAKATIMQSRIALHDSCRSCNSNVRRMPRRRMPVRACTRLVRSTSLLRWETHHTPRITPLIKYNGKRLPSTTPHQVFLKGPMVHITCWWA